MKKDSFLKKVGIYFIGNISTRLISLIVIPIYAFFTSASELGNFDYFTTIAYALYPILFLSIWESSLKFILIEEDNDKVIKITSNVVIFALIMLIFGFIITSALNIIVENAYIIFIFTALYGVTSIWQYYARSIKQNRLYVSSSLLSSIVNIVSISFFIIVLQMGLTGIILSFVISQLVLFLNIELKLKIIKKIKFNYFSFDILKMLLKFSFPLMINHLFLWALSSFGRVYINNNFGEIENGLISFATKISIPISMLGSVIIMSLIEEAIIEQGNHERIIDLIKRVTKIMSFIAILILPTAAIGYFIIQSTEYYNSFSYYPFLLLYSLISVFSSIAGALFQSYGITRYQYITTAIGGIVNVLLIYILVPFMNIYGVLLAQVIGIMLVLLMRVIFIDKQMKFSFPIYNQIIYTLFFTVLSIIVVSIPLLWNILLAVLVCTLTVLINKREIGLLLKRVR